MSNWRATDVLSPFRQLYSFSCCGGRLPPPRRTITAHDPFTHEPNPRKFVSFFFNFFLYWKSSCPLLTYYKHAWIPYDNLDVVWYFQRFGGFCCFRLLPWRRRQQIFAKRRYLSTKLPASRTKNSRSYFHCCEIKSDTPDLGIQLHF
jgi:hypothetical protein